MKMTPRLQISPFYKKVEKKRKRLFSLKSAMKLTSSLIRKFRDMKIADDPVPPVKKRKRFESSTKEEDICDYVMLDLSINLTDRKQLQDITMIESASLIIIDSEKRGSKRFNRNKKSPRARKKFNHKESLIIKELQTDIAVQRLLSIFYNRANFIRPRGLPMIKDIDEVARSFSLFGKVLSIQDHWTQPRGSLNQCPSVWMGSSVTYRSKEDLDQSIKGFSVRQTSMIVVSLVNHLARINLVESKWTSKCKNSKNNGTSIVVEGISARTSRSKLLEEFTYYGTVLNIKWSCGKTKYICEVTYKSTVNAVAAALAMDGKTFLRCPLRTKIKMSAKEMFIHRKLCEVF